jgi:hypothetical protein
MSWDVQVLGLTMSGLFSFGRSFYNSLSWGSYRVYQRGHGLGSIFGGLFKAAMPLLKKGAKTIEREALKTGLNIARESFLDVRYLI